MWRKENLIEMTQTLYIPFLLGHMHSARILKEGKGLLTEGKKQRYRLAIVWGLWRQNLVFWGCQNSQDMSG